MKVKGHKKWINGHISQTITFTDIIRGTKAQYNNDIGFLDLEVRSMSHIKVTDVEVSAFSECFLFFFFSIIILMMMVERHAAAQASAKCKHRSEYEVQSPRERSGRECKCKAQSLREPSDRECNRKGQSQREQSDREYKCKAQSLRERSDKECNREGQSPREQSDLVDVPE